MADVHAPFAALHTLVTRDGAAVLVTVAHVRGSVPREAGTPMLVGHDEVVGTIGGGHLEFEAIRLARAALAQGDGVSPPWVVRFPLAARLGQCCGGVVTLAFEAVGRGCAWLDAAVAAERAGERFARVACLGTTGGIVGDAAGHRGTLGSVDLDAHAARLVREALAQDDAVRVVESPSPAATLLVQVVTPRTFDVLVFGNGHVGRALVPILAAVGARVRWIDARDHDFPRDVPAGVEVLATDLPESELAAAPGHACVLIATHAHALDFTLVAAALARDDWTYLGLIGSRSKRAQFERRLAARGFTAFDLARIACPIGRSETRTLDGKAPGVIALATAAEIVAAHGRAQARRVDEGARDAREAGTAP